MNNIYLCPDTPTGDLVDASGCSDSQKDDDGDGVMNDIDTCASSSIGESVDANGCSNSQKDDDGDGIMNNVDQCSNTPTGKIVDANGCVVLSSNNFNIEVTSETCPNKSNGQIKITANESYSYKATINDVEYSFTDNRTVSGLAPGKHELCIEVLGVTSKQCYAIEIEEGTIISGKASVKSKKATIAIDKGSAPFSVFVNGNNILQTLSTSFTIDVNHGDLIQVRTNVSCEGVFSKTIDLFEDIIVYPNPTKGIFQIGIPIAMKEVTVELYTMHSVLISRKSYLVEYGKVTLSLEDKPAAMYLVKVYLDKPVTLKIIKE